MTMPAATETEPMPDQSHGRRFRICRREDFDRAFARRVFAGRGVLIVYGCENGLPHPRLGVAVGKRLGGAVVRNRWKRLVREAFRQTRAQLPAGVDFVVLARSPMPPPLSELIGMLPPLAQRVAGKLARGSK